MASGAQASTDLYTRPSLNQQYSEQNSQSPSIAPIAAGSQRTNIAFENIDSNYKSGREVLGTLQEFNFLLPPELISNSDGDLQRCHEDQIEWAIATDTYLSDGKNEEDVTLGILGRGDNKRKTNKNHNRRDKSIKTNCVRDIKPILDGETADECLREIETQCYIDCGPLHTIKSRRLGGRAGDCDGNSKSLGLNLYRDSCKENYPTTNPPSESNICVSHYKNYCNNPDGFLSGEYLKYMDESMLNSIALQEDRGKEKSQYNPKRSYGFSKDQITDYYSDEATIGLHSPLSERKSQHSIRMSKKKKIEYKRQEEYSYGSKPYFGVQNFSPKNSNPFFTLDNNECLDYMKYSDLVDYPEDNLGLISNFQPIITDPEPRRVYTPLTMDGKVVDIEEYLDKGTRIDGSTKKNRTSGVVASGVSFRGSKELSEGMNRNIEDADYEESCGDGVLLSESANNNDSKNSTSVIFDQSKEKDKRTIISKINQERYSSQNELRRNYLKRIDKSLEAVIGRSAEPIEEIRPGACEADQEQIENKPAETNETGTSHVEKVSNPKTREGSKKRSRLNKKLTPKYLLQSQDSDNNEKIENRMKKSSRWIGDHATEILENWYASHVNHPYPTKEERDLLEKDTKLASFRINAWLSNKRNRNNNTLPKNRMKIFHGEFRQMLRELLKILSSHSNELSSPSTSCTSSVTSITDDSEIFYTGEIEKPTDAISIVERLMKLNDCLDSSFSSGKPKTNRIEMTNTNHLTLGKESKQREKECIDLLLPFDGDNRDKTK